MALAFFEEGPVSLDPRAALHVPIGAASPLWLLFAGAASSGMAYWWMTRWTLRTNLEAVLAPPAVEVELETEVMIPTAQLVAEPAEAIEAAVEQTSPLIEALAEPEPVEIAPSEPTVPEPTVPEPARAKPKAKPPGEPPSEL